MKSLETLWFQGFFLFFGGEEECDVEPSISRGTLEEQQRNSRGTMGDYNGTWIYQFIKIQEAYYYVV